MRTRMCAPGRARQQMRLERRVLTHMAVQQRAAVGLVENRTAVERIDDQAFVRVVGVQIVQHAHQEVAGKIDALGAQARTPRDLDVHERQRDGDAGATVEHFVEATVARVVVLFAVAEEAELVEQVAIERVDARRPSGASWPGSSAMR